jgi:putative PEP-CTERM system histidine kinase
MTALFYILNLALLFSCFLDLRVKEAERHFSFGLVRIILTVPLLAGEYIYFSSHLQTLPIAPLIFSENVCSLLIINMAYRMRHTINPASQKPYLFILTILSIAAGVLGAGGYWIYSQPVYARVEDMVILPQYGLLYFSSLFVLIAALGMVWRLEAFWRALAPKSRWEYKYVVIGFFLLCGAFAWSSSYRITYLRLVPEHFLLLAIFLLIAWVLIVYGITRHRLLNRRIFVSRQVVYSTIAPLIFAGYLLLLGVVSLLMRACGFSLPFILQWLLVIIGLLLILALALSGKARHRVKYFISTHFYVNKYEYRDEWLAFSYLLRGELNEKGVVNALRQVLSHSLYTTDIMIWLGDDLQGYKFISDQDDSESHYVKLEPDDPLILYLKKHERFYLPDSKTDIKAKELAEQKQEFFNTSNNVLMVPLAIGEHCVGLIGLGPEFTGGIYGNDDFDLLAALGSQAASALLAVRMAEELAHAREQAAWKILSAFVLHDIKNAATMLSLAWENAPAHINNPEFQQDLLESLDDALKRMAKVQTRLHSLEGDIVPVWQELTLCPYLEDCIGKLAHKLPDLVIDLQCVHEKQILIDPEFFSRILENLLLNSLEAGGAGTQVLIQTAQIIPEAFQLEIIDNGPGIPPEFLPDLLFEPFKTSKSKGSGIGLWQVRSLLESLGCSIAAENIAGGGARFMIRLPAGGAGMKGEK